MWLYPVHITVLIDYPSGQKVLECDTGNGFGFFRDQVPETQGPTFCLRLKNLFDSDLSLSDLLPDDPKDVSGHCRLQFYINEDKNIDETVQLFYDLVTKQEDGQQVIFERISFLEV